MSTEMHGILERVLVRQYGQPELEADGTMQKRIWRRGTVRAAVLYYPADWTKPPGSNFGMHCGLYGACCGGTLVSGALKVAMISPATRFDIYNIRELGERDEVKRVAVLDPAVACFMEASNVWFYGHKCGQMFVYDSETDELDHLGPIEAALERVIVDWEASSAGN